MLNDVINEYDTAFQKTQPHSPSYFGVRPDIRKNRVEEFVIEVERKGLNRRVHDATMLLNAKKVLLDIAEEQLRRSCDIYDVLYTAKWVDRKKTKDIIRDLNRKGFDYCPSHVYEIIKQLSKEIDR